MSFMEMLETQRVVPVLRVDSANVAEFVVHAMARGGMRLVELTATTPDVLRTVRRFRDRPDVVIGVGTVETVDMVDQAVDAGARFLVTYRPAEEVAQRARSLDVPYVLGGLTPAEVARCRDLGSPIVKIFPANLVGSTYLNALRGPLPGVRFMPTGGIRLGDVGAWIRAGATAVGIGGELVGKEPWD